MKSYKNFATGVASFFMDRKVVAVKELLKL
jgi:hypothetical protein